ncbi:hypothetical protein [Streptomyces sp. NPDC003863]
MTTVLATDQDRSCTKAVVDDKHGVAAVAEEALRPAGRPLPAMCRSSPSGLLRRTDWNTAP